MRVLLSVPILVSGKTADGKDFKEDARTLVVNAHGALIALAAQVVPASEVTVANKATQKVSGMPHRPSGQRAGRQDANGHRIREALGQLLADRFPTRRLGRSRKLSLARKLPAATERLLCGSLKLGSDAAERQCGLELHGRSRAIVRQPNLEINVRRLLIRSATSAPRFAKRKISGRDASPYRFRFQPRAHLVNVVAVVKRRAKFRRSLPIHAAQRVEHADRIARARQHHYVGPGARDVCPTGTKCRT